MATLREVLLIADERFVEHDAGRSHPERPERVGAALDGVRLVDPDLAAAADTPRAATRAELEMVHSPDMIDFVAAVAARGGGHLDPDTRMAANGFSVASLAAGAVLTAAERLESPPQRGDRPGATLSAYCLVRPPGHHATEHTSMGFCLFNSVAVAAAVLAAQGQRVAIVDIDAHHGNGTQDIFADRADVLYASIHQFPLYPGTGAASERGSGAGVGFTVNVPVPPGATGDVARVGLEEVILPALDRFAPDWMIISVGYDGHRADPLTHLGYSAADYGHMVRSLARVAPRTVAVLEGGYDLEAIRLSSAAVVGALCGVSVRSEAATSGGPGMAEVKAMAAAAADGSAQDDFAP